jgi:hypothetical protein
MDLIIWFLIGAGFLFVLLFVLGGIILYRVSNKTKIRFNILLKAKRWRRFKLPVRKVSKDIKDHDQAYTFDDRALIKGKYVDDIYYYEGNPNPIIFDFSQNMAKIQARDLQTILDSDLIEKLFSEKRLARMEMLLLIILIITAITLIVSGAHFAVHPNIASTANAKFIANITRTVLTGGNV